MKKVVILTIWILVSVLCTPLFAVTYCATSSWGYAGSNVTGGGNATPTLVSNITQLTNALSGTNPKVVIITQDIEFTHRLSVDVSNLTLMALPGKKLYSNQRNTDDSGILILKGSSNNIILRNLTFVGPGAYDCNGFDNLSMEGATNVWVDHCDFQDGMDGNFDIKNNVDNITVSWCRFRYFKAPIPRGPGGDSDDHRFSNLIGSGSSNKPTDGWFNITYGYCWWDEGCRQRMTRCRNAELHFLNCYWNSSVADYYVGPENAKCYFEGCSFEGNANDPEYIWWPFNNSTNACKFFNCAGNLPSNEGSVSTPDYDYDHLTAAKAKTCVTNASCGAGATLTVTTAGAVSATCPDEPNDGTDPEDPDPEDPDPEDPETKTITWNFSTSDFTSGTMTSTVEVNGLYMVCNTDTKGSMIIDADSREIDGLSFTRRLQLVGTGHSNNRHVKFAVTGNCSIIVYLMSTSKTDARTLNVDAPAFGTHIGTLTAPAGNIGKQTFTYTGGATTIYLYSAASGINLYGIDLQYDSPTGIEAVPETTIDSKARKIIREGQLLILRDGKTYSILGARVD